MDHYQNPRNVGSLNKNDKDVGTGIVGAPACGDVMKLQIMVDDSGLISDVKFKTFGCGSAIASSSFMTERVKGLTLDEAGAIKNTEIARELSLPPVKLHCSMLAEDAIRSAIRNYKSKAQERGTSFTGSIDVSQSVSTGETTAEPKPEVAESLSLEETNAMRIKIGLKPIQADGPPAEDKEKSAESNYATLKADEQKQRDDESQREKIAKARNKLELNKRLKGKTLADDTGEDDAKKWAKRIKRKQKEAADRIAKQQAELDTNYQQDYNESHLSGLKVAHDIEDFAEGKEHVLTLKDTGVLDDGDDELQNLDLAEDERGKERAELRKGVKAHQYTGLDDDEFTTDGDAKKPSLLSKYDDDLNGSSESGFRLGDAIAPTKPKVEEDNALTQGEEKVNKTMLSLDYLKNQEASDFLKEGDVGFKKPKTKKKKKSSRKIEIKEEEDQDMEVDVKPPPPRERANLEHSNFIDDDDLQIALAKQRREKLKKKSARQRKPEDIAAEIKNLEEFDKHDDKAKEGGLEFDDTSEFIRTVQLAPQQEAFESKVKSEPLSEIDLAPPTAEVGEDMDVVVEDVDGIRQQQEQDEETVERVKSESPSVPSEMAQPQPGKGLGGILASLKQQGQIETLTPEQREKERVQQNNTKFLAEQRMKEIIREEEKLRIRNDHTKTQAQRDFENRQRDAKSAQEDKEAFERNYKPSVDIKYFDETGRSQSTKEAWKYLNYKFHGKGQGTKGREKALRKVENERKQLAMTSGETPLNMMSSFQARQEATGSAHMVLSVGNRGAAPQADTLYDPDAGLSKGKKRAESADRGDYQRGSSTGVASVESSAGPAPPVRQGTSSFVPISGTASGTPTSETEKRTKSSFAPIGNGTTSSGGTQSNEQGGLKLGAKISFGKRKSDVQPDNNRDNKQIKLDD
ncbi:hypothetical protein E3Q16_03436 [Wallemia mellicola]|uniref:NIF system FeS cluster assembly NifU N-terminal domain-containing protein n=1 Tax=Wallemia mellicola TaxID=1708541 RepID=A0AB38MQT2_9BASI|nr:hypothetical protein E3Q16_03436 [Wallemia mellicola]TIC62356.1 hypothetical protein E3Q02_03521 [Wallemia mellicola]